MEEQITQTINSFYDLELAYKKMRQSVALETLDLLGPQNAKNIVQNFDSLHDALLFKVLQNEKYNSCIIAKHLKQLLLVKTNGC